MSDDYNEPGIQLESIRPMVDATEPPKEEEKTFSSDMDGLQDAADVKPLPEDKAKPFPIQYNRVVDGVAKHVLSSLASTSGIIYLAEYPLH